MAGLDTALDQALSAPPPPGQLLGKLDQYHIQNPSCRPARAREEEREGEGGREGDLQLPPGVPPIA
jgi:hypothetical protein